MHVIDKHVTVSLFTAIKVLGMGKEEIIDCIQALLPSKFKVEMARLRFCL